jgi:hypothetical protein
MPRYINTYLDRLLRGMPCDNDVNTDAIYSLKTKDELHHSRTLANCILNNFHFSDLAYMALSHSGKEQKSYGGLRFEEIVEVLLTEGHIPLQKARTRSQIARRLESSIKLKKPMPTIQANWIKSTLRPLLYEYIVDSLGFARADWNRR